MNKYDANDLLQEAGKDGLRDEFDASLLQLSAPDEGKPEQKKKPAFEAKAGLRATLFSEIDLNPRKQSLVPGLLGKGEQSSFFGAPGSGKSAFVGYLGGCLAASIPWCGRDLVQCGVLYVAAERAELVKRRFAAFRLHHGAGDIPLAVISGMLDLRSSRQHVDAIANYAARLTDITKIETGLVIIDTTSRALAGGDENSPKDMGALVEALAMIGDRTKAHVTNIHHVPLDGPPRLRGHGSLLGAMDMVAAIEKFGDRRTMTVMKDNDGIEGQSLAFNFKSVLLSRDENTGEETTAPIVVALDGGTTASSPPVKKLPNSAAVALRALQEAVDDCGAVPSPSAQIPQNKKCVRIEQWRSYAYKRGISGSDEPRAKQKAFRTAHDTLIAGFHVGTWDDLVWPAN